MFLFFFKIRVCQFLLIAIYRIDKVIAIEKGLSPKIGVTINTAFLYYVLFKPSCLLLK